MSCKGFRYEYKLTSHDILEYEAVNFAYTQAGWKDLGALLEKVSRSLSSLNGKRMGLRYTPQSTGPRFNPCDVDIVVAILDDCRHRWIGGHNVFEVVFIRKYYNLIEPRRENP